MRQFKWKLLIGLNSIMILTNRPQRCYVEIKVFSLTSSPLNVVCHREQSLALLYLISITQCLLPSVPRMHADDTHITQSCWFRFASNSVSSISRPWKAKQMTCMYQTYLERYKNGIYADRLQEKINHSIRCTNSPLIMFRLNKFPVWNNLKYNPWLSNVEWFPHGLT